MNINFEQITTPSPVREYIKLNCEEIGEIDEVNNNLGKYRAMIRFDTHQHFVSFGYGDERPEAIKSALTAAKDIADAILDQVAALRQEVNGE